MSAKRIARDRCVPYSPRTFAQEWTWKTNEFSHERGRKRRGRIKTLTTRDGVASDALPSEPTAHSAREVVETGLAGAVGVSFVVRDHDPFNRTNLAMVNEHNQWPREQRRGSAHIDDTSRVEIGFTLFSTLVGGSSKERQALLGEGEHPVKVQRQDFGPSLILRNPIAENQQPSGRT
jgi:hypothetical protein